uniref:EamA domain-containing protein n=1 Tax=Pyramimonas obovata TaxID=1411642 RepID=A0A7S0R3B2_9CHLO|mmetsp:Transcript_2472/g.5096  ORF Transcript_2472/g.5096 Transcript_2472/m.5096 type:complete len:391 (+) Transcript_2472:120-1292(+)|eukprot:CAMPEP_0118933348 /NCGR_PEP_ID=MMETSP1169-20130426/11937_1 /TAXON_ID=36882 /ORGANISM="Pyramimonas obovata, Strain CCMP722" /LENGTH=390 /DNA_ID=CAMNT_0006876099 /DNA_START=105 /DNA_END=1277 /DNA_ORIENTATION=-
MFATKFSVVANPSVGVARAHRAARPNGLTHKVPVACGRLKRFVPIAARMPMAASTPRTGLADGVVSCSRPIVASRNELQRSRTGVVARNSADATAEPSSDAPNPAGTFLVGVMWFFAHQLIGVGNDVIMKYTGQNLAVAQVVFLRFLFATISMIPVMLASGMDSFKTDRIPLHIARSALLAGGIFMYCKGLTIAPIAMVTTLNFTIPLFTLVLAAFVLKEKVDATRWIGTLVGFAGVTVVVQPGAATFNPMYLIILVSAFMFASLDVLNKVFVGKESFWAMIFYTALFTTIICAIPAMGVWVAPTQMQLILLAILGGGANLLLYCLLKSFSLVDASALAPFRYVELIWSAAVGLLVFGEVPAMSTLYGALIIIPSTLYVVWAENRKAKAE